MNESVFYGVFGVVLQFVLVEQTKLLDAEFKYLITFSIWVKSTLLNLLRGPPLPNVTRHSGWWQSTVTPSIDQALHQFLTLLLILTLLPNLTFYLIARGFHRTFATGAACQQRTLTPPDTWSCPTLGLASVLMLRPISPELVLFLDFWVSNIPRYFCFCLKHKIIHHLINTINMREKYSFIGCHWIYCHSILGVSKSI